MQLDSGLQAISRDGIKHRILVWSCARDRALSNFKGEWGCAYPQEGQSKAICHMWRKLNGTRFLGKEGKSKVNYGRRDVYVIVVRKDKFCVGGVIIAGL